MLRQIEQTTTLNMRHLKELNIYILNCRVFYFTATCKEKREEVYDVGYN